MADAAETRRTNAATQQKRNSEACMGILSDLWRCLIPDQSLDRSTEHIPDETNYERGVEFEKYVIRLFGSNHFALHDWTRDISGKNSGFVVESDSNPDLVMRYKPRDELFAVECKFRASLFKGAMAWTNHRKLRGYKAYAEQTGIPTFVVVGLGGQPDAPERMFCVPLADAKYPAMYPSIFEKFERKPSKRFFWDGRTLV